MMLYMVSVFFLNTLYNRTNVYLKHNQWSQNKSHSPKSSFSHSLCRSWNTWFNLRQRCLTQGYIKKGHNPTLLPLHATLLNWVGHANQGLLGLIKCRDNSNASSPAGIREQLTVPTCQQDVEPVSKRKAIEERLPGAHGHSWGHPAVNTDSLEVPPEGGIKPLTPTQSWFRS